MRIGAENIDHIEIVRGAASAKYGADAIGGVVNVITKAPIDKPSLQFNSEVSYHTSRYTSPYESSALPSNFYLRADSGKIGKFSVAGWASKRYIMPVYSSERTYGDGGTNVWTSEFKPSLRYYGDVRNSGVRGHYDFNENHSIDFQMTSERDDLERRNKSATDDIGSAMEPMQVWNRNLRRDTYAFSYKGKGGTTDWTVDISHGKSREQDTATLEYPSGTTYGGSHALASVDWLEHQQTDVKLSMNTAINDNHLLSYGIGHSREWATGTRLRNAPTTRLEQIDPWAYDQSLRVTSNSASNTDEALSYVHNFELVQTKDGGLIWDKDKEFYNRQKPVLTYDDVKNMDLGLKKTLNSMMSYNIFDPTGKFDLLNVDQLRAQYGDIVDKFVAFNDELKKQNDIAQLVKDGKITNPLTQMAPALAYYGAIASAPGQVNKNLTYNGWYYGQGYDERNNQVTVGEAELNKTYAYIQDMWQVNDDTILTPSLRLDHSDKFGSKITGNIGLTHNLNGNAHRRFKANIGTGYSEPGLGELYYNWEMFGAAGTHLGWYWIGNPDLKPETSLNFDVSLEGESNKTYAKVSLFHNEIKNYMTSYFTGQLIDFGFGDMSNAFSASMYHPAPDRIYSFRNLGKAKITGLEAEVQQKFNNNWSAKLGYTWLHAMNDSDKDMPDRLLDRPTHKIDVGLNYKNNKGDFRGAFWGSYYINMLDSNSVSTESLFEQDENHNYIRKQGTYKEKTFGIWNVLFEKDFGKDITAYVGVDNVFNHRDDDRAFQDRVYRAGINVKLSDLGNALFGDNKPVFHKDADGNPIITNVYGDSWFLSRPNDIKRNAGDVEFYGDYKLQSSMYKGSDKTAMRQTKTTQPTAEAAKNHADKAEHGLEQKLRFGVNYQIADGLNLDVVGATSKRDTSYSVSDKRGLHDPYLEKAELTKSTKKWDWSVGRIHEPMGVTGYWFGKEYDGVRVKYTDNKTQVTVGYGDFSQTTGVTDSAYNHKEYTVIQRGATLGELLGLSMPLGGSISGVSPVTNIDDTSSEYNYYAQFNKAKTPEEKLQVIKNLLSVLKHINDTTVTQFKGEKVDGDAYTGFWNSKKGIVTYYTPTNPTNIIKFNALDVKIDTANGSVDLSKQDNAQQQWGKAILDGFTFDDALDEGKLKDRFKTILTDLGATAYYDTQGNKISSLDDAVNHIFSSYVGNEAYYTYDTLDSDGFPLDTFTSGDNNSYNALSKLLYYYAGDADLQSMSNQLLNGSTVPLPGVPLTFRQMGYLLKQDKIPAMDRAAFVKVRQQLSDNVGIEAWKLNSFGEGAYDALGQKMKIADVIGIGTKVRLGDRSMFSFDYGQNRSAMGKYFHGGMGLYGEKSGGSTPDFFVARLDMGIADTDVPGSWNAYLDYKSFDHGAFLGGTGADLPDRYLDGIRSFTAGLGYVPARNLLLEASYTFDAHSTQKRDTLYTPENFSLGDYTRVSFTYKF